ncbi:MAG: hypothetical protein KC777_19235 [Cyanobacteria bacterium HKST-UBA02]|nr:hypothetical protein [Cyanobacteria bacterium HKST-UBA02]
MFWRIVDNFSPLLGILVLIPGFLLGGRNRSALLALVVTAAVVGRCYYLTVYTPVVDITGVPVMHVALMAVSWYVMLGFVAGAALGMIAGAIDNLYMKHRRKGF